MVAEAVAVGEVAVMAEAVEDWAEVVRVAVAMEEAVVKVDLGLEVVVVAAAEEGVVAE